MRRGLSTQEVLALLEQLDSYISGDDSNNEDFRVDNVNLQKASSFESSDSNIVEHCVNVISPVHQNILLDIGGRKGEGKTYQIFLMSAVTISTLHAVALFGLRLTLSVPFPLQVVHQLAIL